MRASRLSAALALALGGAAVAAGQGVWIEGEEPAHASFTWQKASHALLSAGQWLNYTAEPKPGARKPSGKDPGEPAPLDQPLELKYEFSCPKPGEHAFWVRLGYEGIRAPLRWRIDDGPWSLLAPETPTTSLMELWVWCEVAWAKAGTVHLAAGKHSLTVQYTHAGRGGRVLIGLDCLAFVPGNRWGPDGALKPGQTYDAEIDRQAAEKVFALESPPVAAAQRIELPLDGPWQVARYDDPDMAIDTYAPVKTLPTPEQHELRWRGVKVPGEAERPDLVFGHRLVYRTRVAVPGALAGRSFVLHFSGTCWIASVLVNGEYAGAHTSVLVPWDLDITRAVKSGQVNTIDVVIKDGYYALDHDTWLYAKAPSINAMRNTPRESLRRRGFLAPIYPSSKGEGDATRIGLTCPVKLVVAGPAYTSDVFVRPSVSRKRLDATVTLSNPSAAAAEMSVRCEAVCAKTSKTEKVFDPVRASVPARASQTVEIGGPWPDARPWWPSESVEDKPDCYLLRTTLLRDGKPLDVREDLFGFREVTIQGKDLLLNGVPWHLFNWVDVGRCKDEREWLKKYHAQSDRFHRIAEDHDRLWGCRERALDFFDRHGIPGRLSTCIDGMFIQFDLNKDVVWANFADHVRQVVRAYRNHPSVLMYSLENELMFINATLRFRKDYEACEDRFAALCKLAKELDPTRPSFGDGAGDCRGQTEINCQHYAWPSGEGFPAAAYRFPVKPEGEDHKDHRKRSDDRKALFVWDGRRPLIGGEEFFYSGNLSGMAWIGGPEVFRGKSYADKAAGLYASIASQGARWQGVTGFCPWTLPLPGAENAFRPRAVFVREWNSAAFGGSELTRTVKIFNDGRRSEPLALKWQLLLDGRAVDDGEKTYNIPAGKDQQDTIVARLPQVERRTDGRIELQLSAAGTTVFTDTRPVAVFPRSGPVAGLNKGTLAVMDPEGSVRRWLDARKHDYVAVQGLSSLPDQARILLVGKDALTAAEKRTGAPGLERFVASGRTAIVLEQKEPLEGEELPLPGIVVAGQEKDKPARPEFRAVGGRSGQIAFPMALAHPVFRDLTPREFFTWGGDEPTFRLSYAAPPTGVIALAQAGSDLGLMPMMEVPVGPGSLLLCQLLVAGKLQTEPAADRLLWNSLAWAAARAAARPGKTLALLSGDRQFQEFLDRTGVQFETSDKPADALIGGADVLVVKATPKTLADLAGRAEAVQSFCRPGRWIMLAGLDAEGLADFNRLVGFAHRLRKFRREAVTFQERLDPLVMGLSDRDMSMLSDEFLASWKNIYWVSDRVFTAVVDGEEIASFAEPSSPAGEGKNSPLAVLTDGLVQADSWRYIQYLNSNGDKVEFAFDRPETFSRMRLWSSPGYYALKDIEVTFDGKAPVPFTLQQTPDVQEIEFSPRQANRVTVAVKGHYPGDSKKDLVQIDDLQLLRVMPADWPQRAALLTQPGGLVKYPIGKGGILLNQIDVAETCDPKVPEKGTRNTRANAAKKLAIYANLLRNLGASFRLVATRPADAHGR